MILEARTTFWTMPSTRAPHFTVLIHERGTNNKCSTCDSIDKFHASFELALSTVEAMARRRPSNLAAE
jgi:hypothetical protein